MGTLRPLGPSVATLEHAKMTLGATLQWFEASAETQAFIPLYCMLATRVLQVHNPLALEAGGQRVSIICQPDPDYAGQNVQIFQLNDDKAKGIARRMLKFVPAKGFDLLVDTGNGNWERPVRISINSSWDEVKNALP